MMIVLESVTDMEFTHQLLWASKCLQYYSVFKLLSRKFLGWDQAGDEQDPGPRLNIKTVLSTYGDFHVKDKMAVRTSYL